MESQALTKMPTKLSEIEPPRIIFQKVTYLSPASNPSISAVAENVSRTVEQQSERSRPMTSHEAPCLFAPFGGVRCQCFF